MIYGFCIFLAYYSIAGLLFASARKWGIDGFRKITLLVIAGEKRFPPPNFNLKIVRIQCGGGS
jgi:hypothetical protein